MRTVSWQQALDQFEHQLDEARQTIDDDGDPVIRVWPPANITTDPIPSGLRDRAQSLLHRCYELEDEIVKRREAIQVDRRARPRLRTLTTEPKASFSTSL